MSEDDLADEVAEFTAYCERRNEALREQSTP